MIRCYPPVRDITIRSDEKIKALIKSLKLEDLKTDEQQTYAEDDRRKATLAQAEAFIYDAFGSLARTRQSARIRSGLRMLSNFKKAASVWLPDLRFKQQTRRLEQ